MKKSFIAMTLTLMIAWAGLGTAEPQMKNTDPTPTAGEPHMQNTNPAPKVESGEEPALTKHMQNKNPNPPGEAVTEEPALTRHMQNRDPSPESAKEPPPPKPEHEMKNANPNTVVPDKNSGKPVDLQHFDVNSIK